jgi:hypothetical protein
VWGVGVCGPCQYGEKGERGERRRERKRKTNLVFCVHIAVDGNVCLVSESSNVANVILRKLKRWLDNLVIVLLHNVANGNIVGLFHHCRRQRNALHGLSFTNEL